MEPASKKNNFDFSKFEFEEIKGKDSLTIKVDDGVIGHIAFERVIRPEGSRKLQTLPSNVKEGVVYIPIDSKNNNNEHAKIKIQDVNAIYINVLTERNGNIKANPFKILNIDVFNKIFSVLENEFNPPSRGL